MGAQGTGKTTQLNYWVSQHPEFHVMESTRRKLAENGTISLNREAKPWDELIIAGDVLKGILSTPSPFIADRSWADKCAYTQLLPYPDEVLELMHEYYTWCFPGFGENDVYIHFPIGMIPIESDGVRDIDLQYQQDIDDEIQFYANYFQLDYYTLLSTSIQDRYLEMREYIELS